MQQRRRLVLLALLATSGARGLAREQVQALLWPDTADGRARHALDQLLYLVRRDLGREAILTDATHLRLNPDVVASDVADFDAAVAAGDLGWAAQLWGGPLLDGVRLAGGPEGEHWLDAQRERWMARYAEVLERLASTAERAEAHADAAEWWRRRAALDPYAARPMLGLMRALAAAGDPAGAVRQARIHAALVRRELESAPDEAVLALAERLTREQTAAAPVAAPAAASVIALEPEPAAPATIPAPHAGENLAVAPAPPSPPARRDRTRVPAFASARAAALAAMLLVAAVVGVAVRQRADAPRPDVSAARAGGIRAIAVLPLTELGATGADDHLADALTEELIHALGRVPELRVVARTSVFALRDRVGDVREIGRRLGAGAVLEGSVQRGRGRVRVHVRLVDAVTGYEQWSESYDRPLGDVLEVPRGIADAVTARLASETTTARGVVPVYAAFEHYLRGRQLLLRADTASLTGAIAALHDALAADARYARPHAALAEAYNALAMRNSGRAAQAALLAQAEASARRAVALDPQLADAYLSLGNLRLSRWDWEGAEREYERALAASPSHAAVHERLGVLLALRGDFVRAVELLRRAEALDPLALNIRASTAYVLNLARRYDDAESVARRVVASAPELEEGHFRLGAVLFQQGRHAEAIGSLETAMRVDDVALNRALPMLGYVYARAGRRAAALRLRPLVEQGLAEQTVSPYFAAAYLAAIGDRERAFALLDDLGSRRESCLRDLAVDPVMDLLHADPRFARVLAALEVAPPRGS